MVASAVAATAAAVAVALTGCASGSSAARQDGPPGGRVPAGTGYSSDQLEQALLTDIAGYREAAEPESGEYGALRAIQNLESPPPAPIRVPENALIAHGE